MVKHTQTIRWLFALCLKLFRPPTALDNFISTCEIRFDHSRCWSRSIPKYLTALVGKSFFPLNLILISSISFAFFLRNSVSSVFSTSALSLLPLSQCEMFLRSEFILVAKVLKQSFEKVRLVSSAKWCFKFSCEVTAVKVINVSKE